MAATSAGTGGEVRLVDLDVIKRYSLAVRQEWAPAEEVLAALDATREALLHALGFEDDGPGDGRGAPEPAHGPAAGAADTPVPDGARSEELDGGTPAPAPPRARRRSAGRPPRRGA